jgi:predicted dehydrogenase
MQISNFGGSPCTDETGSTEDFSYTSNGTTEAVCYSSSNGYEYDSEVSIGGTQYDISLIAQNNNITSSTIQTIFGSVKPE